MSDLQPVKFKGYAAILGAPLGWDEAQHGKCQGLPIGREDGRYFSFWRMTLRQRLFVLFGHGIWLWVHSAAHPPVMLTVGPGEAEPKANLS